MYNYNNSGSHPPQNAHFIGFTDFNKIMEMARGLKPDFLQDINQSSESLEISNTDLIGQPRIMGNGTMDAGPFEYSDVSLEYSDVYSRAPATKINMAGVSSYNKAVRSGKTFVVSGWIKTTGTVAPKLIIKGNGLLADYELELPVSPEFVEFETEILTPTGDGDIEIWLYNRDTVGYAVFSDLITDVPEYITIQTMPLSATINQIKLKGVINVNN